MTKALIGKPSLQPVARIYRLDPCEFTRFWLSRKTIKPQNICAKSWRDADRQRFDNLGRNSVCTAIVARGVPCYFKIASNENADVSEYVISSSIEIKCAFERSAMHSKKNTLSFNGERETER